MTGKRRHSSPHRSSHENGDKRAKNRPDWQDGPGPRISPSRSGSCRPPAKEGEVQPDHASTNVVGMTKSTSRNPPPYNDRPPTEQPRMICVTLWNGDQYTCHYKHHLERVFVIAKGYQNFPVSWEQLMELAAETVHRLNEVGIPVVVKHPIETYTDVEHFDFAFDVAFAPRWRAPHWRASPTYSRYAADPHDEYGGDGGAQFEAARTAAISHDDRSSVRRQLDAIQGQLDAARQQISNAPKFIDGSKQQERHVDNNDSHVAVANTNDTHQSCQMTTGNKNDEDCRPELMPTGTEAHEENEVQGLECIKISVLRLMKQHNLDLTDAFKQGIDETFSEFAQALNSRSIDQLSMPDRSLTDAQG